MPLTLTEEQKQLQESAENFFKDKAPVSALRRLRDEKDSNGFCRELYKEISALGWPGTIIPGQYGGLDFGFTGLGLILEAAGRTLAATPLISSVALSASAIILGGSEAQKNEILPKIASGDCLIALALQEGSHHRPGRQTTRAVKTPQGYRISGVKTFVIDGHVADKLIVVARSKDSGGPQPEVGSDGISLFLVDANNPGVVIHRSIMVDSRNAAEIRLNDVLISDAAVIGQVDGGADILRQVIDRGNIALAAEMMGSLQAAFERTMDYIKQREQFGQIIGSFQGLQHRASQMFCEIALCKSVLIKALQGIDENDPQLSQLASLAKVQVGETFKLVSNEAIQMFGGIGMTDEEEIGFFLKRARVALQTLGDENYHLQEYASLRGY